LAHSIAQGSLAVAFFLQSWEFITTGTGTPRSGMVSLSARRKSTRKVLSSTTTNCSGFSSEPAAIWKVGKPPTVTARSNDHFTSLAVMGVPSWNLASLRNLKVAEVGVTFQSVASSGSSLV